MDEKQKKDEKEISVYGWNKLKTGLRLIRPSNFSSLDSEDKIKAEETMYFLQLKHNHGFLLGEFDEISRANK